MFNGALSAIVTPFRDGEVDERALRDHIEWQIQSGVDGIVPCGSTGESATLTHAEHDRVIKITIEQTRRRVPVVAGTGSNSTAEAIRLTTAAREMGADGALMISPYYNKPTQEGIFRHYKMIAAAVDLPTDRVQHSGPHRLEHRARDLRAAVRDSQHRRHQGSLGLDGSDLRYPPAVRRSTDDSLRRRLADGADHGAGRQGRHRDDFQRDAARDARPRGGGAGGRLRARARNPLQDDAADAYVCSSRPIRFRVKQALAFMGRCANELRMPLCPMSAPAAEKLKAAMKEMKLI